MTKLEYLNRRWQEVKALRDLKANQIARVMGDEHWMRAKNIPGSAIYFVSQYVGYGRILAAPEQDIRHARHQIGRAHV